MNPKLVEAKRQELRAWAADLEALRPFDDNGFCPAETLRAWKVAMSKFKTALVEYADAVEGGDGP